MCSVEPGGSATGDVVAGVVALAAELATRPAPDSGAACFAQAETLGRAVDLLESAIAARVGVAARAGQVAEWGHTSPTAWLRTSLGMRHARADERAVLAEQLPRLPQVAKRLAAGELSSGYAAAIASGVRRLDESDCGKAEQVLLGLVDDGHSVGQLIRFADRIKDLIAERDGTAVEPEDGRRAERQWWAVHRSGSGAFVKGRFGAELMALIQARLGPLARPCGAEDARDHAERLADALQAHLSGADSAGADSRWDPILVIDVEQSAMPQRAVPEPDEHEPREPKTREPDEHEPAAREPATPELATPEPATRETVEMPPITAGSARHPAGAPATMTDVEPERTASSRPAQAPGQPAGRPRERGGAVDKADGDSDQHRRPLSDPTAPVAAATGNPPAVPPPDRPLAGDAGAAPGSASCAHLDPCPDTGLPSGLSAGPARGPVPGSAVRRGQPGRPAPVSPPGTSRPPEPPWRGSPPGANRPPDPPAQQPPVQQGPPTVGRPPDPSWQGGQPTAGQPPAPWWPFGGARLTGRLADGTPVPAERVRTILLNAGFSALVLGTDGLPLYLGRRVRCASLAQRRVLVTKYATCVVEGCEIPAIACQIDHVDSWAAGQPTDIDLLVPCCAFHNRYKARHPDRVTIHRDADGRYRYQIARPGGGPGSRYGAREQRRPDRRATGRDTRARKGRG
ncbi:MAG TPA: DUF222 domain-containing protein [Streptosporangiaceae bacterium]